MAKNPMQRKISNAFMLGMVLTMLILGGLVAAGYVFFIVPQLEEPEEEGAMPGEELRWVYVVTEPVRQGSVLRPGINVELREERTRVDGIDSFGRFHHDDIEAVREALQDMNIGFETTRDEARLQEREEIQEEIIFALDFLPL